MDNKIFNKILKGAKHAAAHARGKKTRPIVEYKIHVPSSIDVKNIRRELGMTQRLFSETFGFSYHNVASWEAGRRNPDKSARILLSMIANNPKAVLQYAGH